jgi:hypothetical protein
VLGIDSARRSGDDADRGKPLLTEDPIAPLGKRWAMT